MKQKNRINKRGTLGTIISLVLMLLLMGVTFQICSTIFRTTKQSQETFHEVIQQLKDVSGKPSGSRNLVLAQFNSATAIFGFSRGNKNLEVYAARPDWQKHIDMRKPVECGEDSCVCFCDKPGMQGEETLTGEPTDVFGCGKLRCVKSGEFGNLDIHPHVYTEFMTAPVRERRAESMNGFFLYRSPMRIRQGYSYTDVTTPDVMEGRAAIYLERHGNAIAVCARQVDNSCVAPQTI